jgi:hypothetical protein
MHVYIYGLYRLHSGRHANLPHVHRCNSAWRPLKCFDLLTVRVDPFRHACYPLVAYCMQYTRLFPYTRSTNLPIQAIASLVYVATQAGVEGRSLLSIIRFTCINNVDWKSDTITWHARLSRNNRTYSIPLDDTYQRVHMLALSWLLWKQLPLWKRTLASQQEGKGCDQYATVPLGSFTFLFFIWFWFYGFYIIIVDGVV